MTIVYESVTGFTREYATLLGQATGLPVLDAASAKGALPAGAPVLYLGWLCAGHISGLDKAVKAYHVVGACGVGLTQPSQTVLQELGRSNYLPDGPLFYLHGGYAPQQLKGLRGMMLGAVAKGMRKQYAALPHPDELERKMLTVLETGGSFVDEGNLQPVLDWLNTSVQ